MNIEYTIFSISTGDVVAHGYQDEKSFLSYVDQIDSDRHYLAVGIYEKSRFAFDGSVIVEKTKNNDKKEFCRLSIGMALSLVDSMAGEARLRYITSIPGQAETYAKKEQQARDWSAESFAGDAPSFIAAEAQALSVSAQSVALEVIALADYWAEIKGPQIEASRRKWKVAIEAAVDPSLISGLIDSARTELEAL